MSIAPTSWGDVSVQEQSLTIGKGTVRVLTAGPSGARAVLLLHGATFRAELWQETGTVDVLVRAGYRVVAPDLPGHGKHRHTGMPPDEVMLRIIRLLGLEKPVVIGHSLGGGYALSLVAHHSEALSAAVLVSPTWVPRLLSKLENNPLPILVLWGAEDRMVPVRRGRQLAAALPNSRLVLLEGAGHECYQQRPEAFHAEIVAFLGRLSDTR